MRVLCCVVICGAKLVVGKALGESGSLSQNPSHLWVALVDRGGRPSNRVGDHRGLAAGTSGGAWRAVVTSACDTADSCCIVAAGSLRVDDQVSRRVGVGTSVCVSSVVPRSFCMGLFGGIVGCTV